MARTFELATLASSSFFSHTSSLTFPHLPSPFPSSLFLSPSTILEDNGAHGYALRPRGPKISFFFLFFFFFCSFTDIERFVGSMLPSSARATFAVATAGRPSRGRHVTALSPSLDRHVTRPCDTTTPH